MLQSFVRLTEFAQERAVRAVLIAGDLFDGARVRARTVDALLAAINIILDGIARSHQGTILK